MWHSSAHLMAEALEFHYPGIKLAIGPPIENGFYYDIDFMGQEFSEEDLPKLEKKMIELAREKNAYVRKEVSKADALAYFEERQDPYKLELINDLEDGEITFYTQGNFTDLCRGPHIPHTGYIKAVKLLSVAGAYWRGDENKPMLTRIYGITFPKQKELDEYLEMLEEAKKTALAIAAQGPVAVALCKQVMNEGEGRPLNDANALEVDAFGKAFESDDQSEGMAAFLEKRPAAFKGR